MHEPPTRDRPRSTRRRGRVALIGIASIVAASPLGAQDGARDTTDARPPAACDGRTIGAIEIRPGRPPFSGAAGWWRHAARAVGLHHATTRDETVEAFLGDLRVGAPCVEHARMEAERVLRAQPYLASANIRVEDAGDGTARVIVETTDEISIIAQARLSGLSLQALSLGNGNIAGRGLEVTLHGTRGGAYRTGFGAQAVSYAAFGTPAILRAAATRDPLGHAWDAGIAHPFYSDLQGAAWLAMARGYDAYVTLRRPADDGLALEVREDEFVLGAVKRVTPRRRAFALLGPTLSGGRIIPASHGVVITDSGLAPDSGVALRERYASMHAVRVGAIAGLRALTFHQARGFDALTAVQDVAGGVSLLAHAAQGVAGSSGRDLLLSGQLYAGATGRALDDDGVPWLAAIQVDGDIRHDPDAGRWSDGLASSRAAIYARRGRSTLIVSDELSFGWRTTLPFQLALGDPESGVRGYELEPAVAAGRNVLRIENRIRVGQAVGRADVGVAAFADVGTLWAGAVPYGETARARPSVGVSLLGGYPVGSKRLYRVDIAFPLGPDLRRRVAVLFSVDPRGTRFWRDPRDVARSRIAPPLTGITWTNP